MNEPWEDLTFRVPATAYNAEQCVGHHRQPMNCGKGVWTHLRMKKYSLFGSFQDIFCLFATVLKGE